MSAICCAHSHKGWSVLFNIVAELVIKVLNVGLGRVSKESRSVHVVGGQVLTREPSRFTLTPVNTPPPPVEIPVEVAVTVLISVFSFSPDMVTCGSTESRQMLGVLRWDGPGLAEF